MIVFNFLCVRIKEWADCHSLRSNSLHFLQALARDCLLKGETAALFHKIWAIPFFNLVSVRNSFWFFLFFLLALTPNMVFFLPRLAMGNLEPECICLFILWSRRVHFRFYFWITTVLIKHGWVYLFGNHLSTIHSAFRFIMLNGNFCLVFKQLLGGIGLTEDPLIMDLTAWLLPFWKNWHGTAKCCTTSSNFLVWCRDFRAFD